MPNNVLTEEEKDLIPEKFSAHDLEIYREMMKIGVMYGHKKSKTNPKFKPYIHATRNGVEIVDLGVTLKAIEETAEFLNEKIKDQGTILFAATQPAARRAIENLANKFKFPYVVNRWLGGLLTNFKVISNRLERFKEMRVEMEKGGFDKYTKKERVMINHQISRMSEMFTGLDNLTKLPSVLFVVDGSIKGHKTAIHEAKLLNIPIVGIIDSDDNPEDFDCFVPANDHAKISIDWILKNIEEKLKV